MNLDAWKSLGSFMIGTVGGLAGLTFGVLSFAGVTSPVNSRETFMVLGVILGILSVTAFVGGFLLFLRIPTKDPLANANMVVGSHVTRWARSAEDVNNAYALFTKLLPGDSSVNLPMMHALFAHNSETIFVVERADGTSRRLVGMGIIAPITHRACQEILAKEFRSILDANLSIHAQRDWVKPAGVYVGGAAADPKDPLAAVRVLDYIAIISSMSGAGHVFAHPVSPQGKRIMEHTGFYPIGDETSMWVLRGHRILDYRAEGYRRIKSPEMTEAPSAASKEGST